MMIEYYYKFLLTLFIVWIFEEYFCCTAVYLLILLTDVIVMNFMKANL